MKQRIIYIGVVVFSMATIFMGCDRMGELPQHRSWKSERMQSTPPTTEQKEEISSNADQLLAAFNSKMEEMELHARQFNEETRMKWAEKLQSFKKREEEIKTAPDSAKLEALNREMDEVATEMELEIQKMKETATPVQKEVGGDIEDSKKDLSSNGNHFEQKTEESASEVKSENKDGVHYYRETSSEKMESIKEEVKYRSDSNQSSE